MAVTINKGTQTKKKSGVKVVGQKNVLTEKVDEFIEAEAKYQKLRTPLEAAKAERDAQLEALCELVEDTHSPEQAVTVNGETGAVELSPVPLTVQGQNSHRLVELLGQDKYMDLSEIKVSVIRAVLPKEHQKEVLIEVRTGKRRAKVST